MEKTLKLCLPRSQQLYVCWELKSFWLKVRHYHVPIHTERLKWEEGGN